MISIVSSVTDVDTPRSIAAEALGAPFTGPPGRRLSDASHAADHLECVLHAINSGEISASTADRARLEGAAIALRSVSAPTPRTQIQMQSEETVRQTFPRLDTWRLRAQHPHTPEPGSDLAALDAEWPHSPASQLAAAALGAARDHLGAVQEHIESGSLHPFADRSLLRTATLGAAQAVWMLAPDDPARRAARTRTVATETYEKHLQYLDGLLQTTDDQSVPDRATQVVAEHVRQRLQQLTDVRDQRGERAKFESTAIIRDATKAVLGAEYAAEAVVEWRRASGAAHGLSWSILGLPSTRQTGQPGEDGLAAFEVTGDVAGIANAFMLAFHLSAHGWRLLDQRSRNSDAETP